MTAGITGRQGPRLGRRFAGHDPRSRSYGVRPLLAAVPVQRRPTFWPFPDGPFPLDQGAEGACTGYGMAHELAMGPVQFPLINDAYARGRYLRNQEEDREMGNVWPDGASVLATMRAAQDDGLISGYRWCFGVDDVVDTLCTVGPVCLGIDWLSGMYETGPGGRVLVQGEPVGGHFIVLAGYDVHPHWGPCVLWSNTWGSAYGVGDSRLGVSAGVGWLTVPDLERLLARNGEAVVPADFFAGLPLPTPEPVPVPAPAPEPVPAPEPTPWRPDRPEQSGTLAALLRWLLELLRQRRGR